MNPFLKQFYDTPSIRESVKTFMVDCLRDLAVEKTFSGEPVNGIKEARELIDNMFDKLDELYGKIKEPIISNSR